LVRLRERIPNVPIYAVPYREGIPGKPVQLPWGSELHHLDVTDLLVRHLPEERPPYLGLDKGMRPLRRDVPEVRELFWQVWVFSDLTPGAFLLPDGRPALVFGADPHSPS
jgi:hypothetical protein